MNIIEKFENKEKEYALLDNKITGYGFAKLIKERLLENLNMTEEELYIRSFLRKNSKGSMEITTDQFVLFVHLDLKKKTKTFEIELNTVRGKDFSDFKERLKILNKFSKNVEDLSFDFFLSLYTENSELIAHKISLYKEIESLKSDYLKEKHKNIYNSIEVLFPKVNDGLSVDSIGKDQKGKTFILIDFEDGKIIFNKFNAQMSNGGQKTYYLNATRYSKKVVQEKLDNRVSFEGSELVDYSQIDFFDFKIINSTITYKQSFTLEEFQKSLQPFLSKHKLSNF